MSRSFLSGCLLVVWGLILFPGSGVAQEVHTAQFVALPLAVNPAFTGMFDGGIRAVAVYANHWSSGAVPYTTVGGSADFPVLQDKHGNYVAAGLQFIQDRTGDGSLFNANGSFALSYHKFLGLTNFINRHRGCDLAIGLQGSFGNQQIDPLDLFFGVTPAFRYYPYLLGISQGYFMINSGICFTEARGEKLNYTIGIAANNINQPGDGSKEDMYSNLGLNRTLSGTLGLNWAFTQRFVLKPTFYAVSRGSLTGFIGGTEVQYKILVNPEQRYGSTSLFAGIFARTGNSASITGGMESHAFRIGIGYDENLSARGDQRHGNGGLDFSVRYVAPAHFMLSRSRAIPSGHF